MGTQAQVQTQTSPGARAGIPFLPFHDRRGGWERDAGWHEAAWEGARCGATTLEKATTGGPYDGEDERREEAC